MTKRYDIHMHLAGFGDTSNCRLSEKMRKSLVFKILRAQLGLKEGQDADGGYVNNLNKLMATKELDGGVLFAMDAVISDEGQEDWNRSHVFVPNDYLFSVCRQSKKLLPGISINPATGASAITRFVGSVERFLIMSVEPGFGGQSLMPEVLPKIGVLRSAGESTERQLDIAVDGGVKVENAASVIAAGADTLVSGTGIFRYEAGMAAAVKQIKSL